MDPERTKITSISSKTSAAGTLTLASANTYTGTTTVTAGTLRIGVDSVGSVGSITSSAIGTGTLVFNGGKVSASNTSNARTIYNPVTFTGDGHVGDSANYASLTFAADVDLGGAVRTIQANGTQFLNGIISNGGITKTNSGTLVLAGTNTYNGATNINAGTLKDHRIAHIRRHSQRRWNPRRRRLHQRIHHVRHRGQHSQVRPNHRHCGLHRRHRRSQRYPGSHGQPHRRYVTGNIYTVLKVTGGLAERPALHLHHSPRHARLCGQRTPTHRRNWQPDMERQRCHQPYFWDTNTTTNWLNGASPDKFLATDNVTFDDTASSFTVAIQGSSVTPGMSHSTTPVNDTR